MASQAHDDLELIFIPEDWIGQQKPFPSPESTVPNYIHDARKNVLAIPLALAECLLPPDNLPVSELLKLPLPPSSSALLFTDITEWFSKDPPFLAPPTDLCRILKGRPVPPLGFLETLKAGFGQAWFDGSQSIVDPRFNGSTSLERLPLWVLQFWLDIGHVRESKGEWRTGLMWLTNLLGCPHIANVDDAVQWAATSADQGVPFSGELIHAIQTFKMIGWNIRIQGAGPMQIEHLQSPRLAQLLGDNWIGALAMEAVLGGLLGRLERSPSHAKSVMIGTVGLFDAITLSAKQDYGKNTNLPKLMSEYETRIKSSAAIAQMLMPVFVNGNHWIACKIDFKSSTIAYGKHKSLSSLSLNGFGSLTSWVR
ncbi:hypothetical protein EUX98_g9579 [Antrodiella citrinella]|uniref:Ubiquitin-like protease family profile domain-containing protein n=1 Tax=Antrodiella citrinella TaxID=2447956 RepID=A0A4S4LQT9_9APHY|nr:hypothetical protein EUX98_g9579 [Antrodiella citrinella]